jgi:hypothetical protein
VSELGSASMLCRGYMVQITEGGASEIAALQLLGTHQDVQLVNMQLPSPMCALLVWKLIMTAETKPLFLLRCQNVIRKADHNCWSVHSIEKGANRNPPCTSSHLA